MTIEKQPFENVSNSLFLTFSDAGIRPTLQPLALQSAIVWHVSPMMCLRSMCFCGYKVCRTSPPKKKWTNVFFPRAVEWMLEFWNVQMTNLSRWICESYEELICYVSWASIENNSWPQNMVVSKFGISKLPGNGPHFQGLFAVSFRVGYSL